MTFVTYADPIPTPAPLTSGTTIQSFTDPLGDVWVAKNGVNSGNWFRARDVLYCNVYRVQPFTLATSANPPLPMDTVVRDAYGMFNTTNGSVNCPVAGLYRAQGQWRATSTGQQSGNAFITLNNVNILAFGSTLPSVTGLTMCAQAASYAFVNAGDQLYLNQNCTAALACAVNTLWATFLQVKYEGTG